MINQITRMDSMEMVWRWYGDSVESDNFYTDFLAKLVWRFMEKT